MERLRAALSGVEGVVFRYLDDHARLADALGSARPRLVLNLCDTGFRNDARREAHVAALLELLEIPHSGAGPACLGLCYDKAAVRAIAEAEGVAVPREVRIPAGEDPELPEDLPLPAMVKPATGDGSEGIHPESVVRSRSDALARVRALRRELPGRDVLVQEYLPGEEYQVGLVGNPGEGLEALPPLAVDWSGLPEGLPRVLSYGSKTDPHSPYWTEIRYRPAELDPGREATVSDAARRLFERLGCRDYARFDFREDPDGVPRLLEANPNPAWCWDGKMALMAGFAGWGYRGLLERILRAAEVRTGLTPGAGAPPPPSGG